MVMRLRFSGAVFFISVTIFKNCMHKKAAKYIAASGIRVIIREFKNLLNDSTRYVS